MYFPRLPRLSAFECCSVFTEITWACKSWIWSLLIFDRYIDIEQLHPPLCSSPHIIIFSPPYPLLFPDLSYRCLPEARASIPDTVWRTQLSSIGNSQRTDLRKTGEYTPLEGAKFLMRCLFFLRPTQPDYCCCSSRGRSIDFQSVQLAMSRWSHFNEEEGNLNFRDMSDCSLFIFPVVIVKG